MSQSKLKEKISLSPSGGKEGMAGKTSLITGASSGFEALIARRLASAGHRVYVSMRDVRSAAAEEIKQ